MTMRFVSQTANPPELEPALCAMANWAWEPDRNAGFLGSSLMTAQRVAVLLIVCGMGLVAAPVSAQDQGNWTVPRTADGQPDLRGIWTHNSATPFQRPEQLGDKAVFTDEEIAELTQRVKEFREGDDDQAGHLLGDRLIRKALDPTDIPEVDRETGDYNAFWLVEREFDNRTSLIVDPPTGRIPPLTPEAQAAAEARRVYEREHPSDGHEDRPLRDRCIYPAPRLQAGYNSYFLILQTPDHVAIQQEMHHISRVIPIDGRPHIDDDVRLWDGDARGYWDGDTLVVETTNYSAAAQYRGASDGLRLVERFTRVAPDVLEHEVTLHDPSTWTRPWTVKLVLKATEDPIFEFACHEGNYSMEGILRGARREEKTGQSR